MPPRPAIWRRASFSALTALGFVACALSCETFSTPADGADAGTDAPVTDDGATNDGAVGATDAIATDAIAADGGMNLFPLGDFEIGGCTGTGYQSSLTVDSTAHGGARSCRVCSNGPSADVYSFDTDIDGVTPPIGARYVADAWVHIASGATGAPAPAGGVQLALRTHTIGVPVTTPDNQYTAYDTLTGTWQRLTITLDITTAGIPKLELVLDAPYDVGTCFLIDDIVVRREK